MDVSPEQGLRAWVEYLRDMGVYDLYRREAPHHVLPEAVRERMQAASVSPARPAPHLAKTPFAAQESRPAAAGVLPPSRPRTGPLVTPRTGSSPGAPSRNVMPSPSEPTRS